MTKPSRHSKHSSHKTCRKNYMKSQSRREKARRSPKQHHGMYKSRRLKKVSRHSKLPKRLKRSFKVRSSRLLEKFSKQANMPNALQVLHLQLPKFELFKSMPELQQQFNSYPPYVQALAFVADYYVKHLKLTQSVALESLPGVVVQLCRDLHKHQHQPGSWQQAIANLVKWFVDVSKHTKPTKLEGGNRFTTWLKGLAIGLGLVAAGSAGSIATNAVTQHAQDHAQQLDTVSSNSLNIDSGKMSAVNTMSTMTQPEFEQLHQSFNATWQQMNHAFRETVFPAGDQLINLVASVTSMPSYSWLVGYAQQIRSIFVDAYAARAQSMTDWLTNPYEEPADQVRKDIEFLLPTNTFSDSSQQSPAIRLWLKVTLEQSDITTSTSTDIGDMSNTFQNWAAAIAVVVEQVNKLVKDKSRDIQTDLVGTVLNAMKSLEKQDETVKNLAQLAQTKVPNTSFIESYLVENAVQHFLKYFAKESYISNIIAIEAALNDVNKIAKEYAENEQILKNQENNAGVNSALTGTFVAMLTRLMAAITFKIGIGAVGTVGTGVGLLNAFKSKRKKNASSHDDSNSNKDKDSDTNSYSNSNSVQPLFTTRYQTRQLAPHADTAKPARLPRFTPSANMAQFDEPVFSLHEIEPAEMHSNVAAARSTAPTVASVNRLQTNLDVLKLHIFVDCLNEKLFQQKMVYQFLCTQLGIPFTQRDSVDRLQAILVSYISINPQTIPAMQQAYRQFITEHHNANRRNNQPMNPCAGSSPDRSDRCYSSGGSGGGSKSRKATHTNEKRKLDDPGMPQAKRPNFNETP